jgi:hypothetical protein
MRATRCALDLYVFANRILDLPPVDFFSDAPRAAMAGTRRAPATREGRRRKESREGAGQAATKGGKADRQGASRDSGSEPRKLCASRQARAQAKTPAGKRKKPRPGGFRRARAPFAAGKAARSEQAAFPASEAALPSVAGLEGVRGCKSGPERARSLPAGEAAGKYAFPRASTLSRGRARSRPSGRVALAKGKAPWPRERTLARGLARSPPESVLARGSGAKESAESTRRRESVLGGGKGRSLSDRPHPQNHRRTLALGRVAFPLGKQSCPAASTLRRGKGRSPAGKGARREISGLRIGCGGSGSEGRRGAGKRPVDGPPLPGDRRDALQ